MSWGFLPVIDLPPQNQHRFIARVWACEIVRVSNELKVVLQIATPLKNSCFGRGSRLIYSSESSAVA